MRTLNLLNLELEDVILLNEISDEIKTEFNDLLDVVFSASDKDIDWIVSSTFSRNNFLSSIFINCCYLELIKRKSIGDGDLASVIVPSSVLKPPLTEFFRQNHLQVEVVIFESFNSRFRKALSPAINFLISFYKVFSLWISKSQLRKRAVPINKELILLDTFLLESSFKGGRFHDRYYMGILDFLTESERETVYYLPTFLMTRGMKEACKQTERSEFRFILKNDFLKLSDYIFAMMHPFRIKKIDFSKVLFRGINVACLFEDDYWVNLSNFSSVSGILNYRLAKRLSESGVKIKLVVDWFENQVIDKGLNRGFHEFYPSVYRIGYAGFIVSPNYTSYIHPSKIEVRSASIPNEIAVVGSGLINSIREFQNELNVKVAPAFRFAWVWKPFERTHTGKVVLVTLPIALKESREIISLIVKMMKTTPFEEVQFHVKPHPVLKMKKVFEGMDKKVSARFQLVEGSFKDCLQKASVLIGNSSSTCVEALAVGVPVIIIGSQSGLTQNPIPKSISNDIWRLCYTAEELSASVSYFLNLPAEKKEVIQNESEQIRKAYFEPVTDEGVRKFLKL